MPTNYLLRQWQNTQGGANGGRVTFRLRNVISIYPEASGGNTTPTFTRNLAAQQIDHTGKTNWAKSGEARMFGARRVENLIANGSQRVSQTWVGNAWGKNAGSISGATITETNGTSTNQGVYGQGALWTSALNNVWVARSRIKQGTQRYATFVLSETNSAGVTVDLQTGAITNHYAGSHWTLLDYGVSAAQNADGWLVVIKAQHIIVSGSINVGWGPTNSGSNTDQTSYTGAQLTIDVTDKQLENVTGQTNQNPSEYVSVGVLSPPYPQTMAGGSISATGTDGVGYSDRLNGITVASNIETEAVGALIDSTQAAAAGGVTAGVVTADGPIGYYSEGARTNLLGTTSAIRRTMTDVGWAVGATMTRGAATGADGAPSAAASLTGGAVAATNTILFTPGLGAAARTYSLWMKRVTGAGAISITGDGTNYTDISAQLNTSTFRQVQISAGSVVPIVGIKIATAGDVIAADLNQLEAAGFASTAIYVGTATRPADILTFASAGNINASNFTVRGETVWTTVPTAASYFLFGSYVDADNYTAVLFDGTNLIARKRIAGTSHDATKALTVTAGTVIKWAASFSGSVGIDVAYNGAVGTNDATTTTAQLGANYQVGADGNGANQPFASVDKFEIYGVALPASQLAAITTP